MLRAVRAERDERLRLRDVAIVALLVYSGLRVQAACDVQLRDLDLDGGTVTVRSGKGGRPRRVPLHSDALQLLRRYVKIVRCPDGSPGIGSSRECESLREGGTLTAHPVNLVLAVATLATVVLIIGGIIVDQYPCWIGVPNCD